VNIDIAIIGAGPAGAWAGYSLATRGARVTLIDPSHPREKPCGGGVTGRALAIVRPALDAFSVAACDIRAARFVDSNTRRSASVRLAMRDSQSGRDLVVASRAQFDAALVAAARAAGADVLQSRVTDLIAENGGFRIETRSGTVRASRVIGADGANSLVRRRVARPFRRDQLSIATGFFAHGTTSDEIVIELTSDPPGYIWSFPRPDHLAIGICAQADAGVTADALRLMTVEWIRKTGLARNATLQPYSWPIPSLGERDFDELDLAGPRWCLAGDAAGLVDPITREGIFFALTSAQWAADALAAGGDLSTYASRVRDEAIPELAHAARLRTMFFRPAFIALMMDALQQSGAVRAVMADLVAGRQPYATLKWRLLRTFEPRLAWRAIVSARNIRRAL
jgi:geranylgeranyl reductase family protein